MKNLNFQTNGNFTKISKPKVKSYKSKGRFVSDMGDSFDLIAEEKNSWKEIRRKNSKRNFVEVL